MEILIAISLLVAGLSLAASVRQRQRVGNDVGHGATILLDHCRVQSQSKSVWQCGMARDMPTMPKDRTLRGTAHVIDGDTVSIRGVKIRLAGVTAPELDQPWGQKAKSAMVSLCKGQIVTARLEDTGAFDRFVGTCFLPDGRDIGAELVKQGLALDMPGSSHGKYRDLVPEGARRMLARGLVGQTSIKKRIG